MRTHRAALVFSAVMLLAVRVAGRTTTSQDVLTDIGLAFDCSDPSSVAVGTVTDTLTVGGTLSLSVTGTPCAAGKTFLLIDNAGPGPIIGTFTAVPEGGIVFSSSGQPFRISYVGGNGNDLTATALPVAAIPALNTIGSICLLVSLIAIALRAIK